MIVLLNGSPIENGNSAFICSKAKEFIEESGEKVEIINVVPILKAQETPFCVVCGTPCPKVCESKNLQLKEALDKLRKCNGVIAVSPVYFGAVTGQLKAFWDLTRPLRGEKALYNKTGAAVSVGASRFGGQESTIRNIQDMMLIQGMTVVGSSFEDGIGHYGAGFQKPAENDESGIASLKKICKRVVDLGNKK